MDQEILLELRQIKNLLISKKQIWTLNDFCAYTGISKAHVYHLTSTGKIKYYRPFGKIIFFDSEEAIDFLKQNHLGGSKEIQMRTSRNILKKVG